MTFHQHIKGFSLAPGVMALPETIYESELFQDWASRLDPQRPAHITINKAGLWAKPGQPEKVQCLQITHYIEGDRWPHDLMLVPPTVDVLTLAHWQGLRYFIFVEQYRPAVGGWVVSNVAGGIEWGENPDTSAHRELSEELEPSADVSYQLWPLRETPRKVTPGFVSERTWFFAAQFELPSREALMEFVNSLQNKRTGVVEEGERIIVHAVPQQDVWQFLNKRPNVDLKTEFALKYAGM